MHLSVWRKLQVVGVEDGSFTKPIKNTSKALFIAVLLEGAHIIDLRLEKITVDGLDATEKLACMLRTLSFDVLMLAGVSFAGFNLVDPTVIFDEFRKPVIIVSRVKPNNLAVKEALFRHFSDWKVRWSIFEKLGDIYEIVSVPGEPPLYVEVVGTSYEWAGKLLRSLAFCCRVPEPLRVARLIAQGLSRTN